MIEIVKGDITRQEVDAVVNAANSSSKYGRGLPTGQAVATTAGNLPSRWVIHTGTTLIPFVLFDDNAYEVFS